MVEKMEEVEEKESGFEIDFDFEFDVAKYYDFMHVETYDEIGDAELWFEFAQGHEHDPSPWLAKLENGEDDFPDSVTSSPRSGAYSEYSMDDDDSGEYQVSSIESKKETQTHMAKIKPTTQTSCPANSRLLQPTASLLAKKNQGASVGSPKVSSSHQKFGNLPKFSKETDDTKRQKLETGYLHKVGTTDVNSSVKAKATIPKEPDLATSHRGAKQRSKNAPHLENDTNHSGSSIKAKPSNKKVLETQTSFEKKKKTKAPLPQSQDAKVSNGSAKSEYRRTNSNKALQQEKSDESYNSSDQILDMKRLSGKGDVGALQDCTRETNVPREFKLETSTKMSQTPPTELFSKISLDTKNHLNSSLEEQTPQVKALEKNASFQSMKENKISNTITGSAMRCSGYESRMIADIVDHLMKSRSFTIY